METYAPLLLPAPSCDLSTCCLNLRNNSSPLLVGAICAIQDAGHKALRHAASRLHSPVTSS